MKTSKGNETSKYPSVTPDPRNEGNFVGNEFRRMI